MALFSKVFDTFDGKNAILKSTHLIRETQELAEGAQKEAYAEFASLLDLLRQYSALKSEQVVGEIHSDQDAKTGKSRGKRLGSLRSIGHSATSLEPEALTVQQTHSERTINSDKELSQRCTAKLGGRIVAS
jgi:hypothetical protein